MARYVDGFVVPVPTAKLDAYRVLATKAGEVWKEYGALEYVECVADDVKPGDYKDPGWYQHPKGTVAYEYQGDLQQPARSQAPKADSKTLNVRKPSGHSGHSNH